MNQVDVQAIWDATEVDTKKELLLDFIKQFTHPRKGPLFTKQVKESFTVKQLDNIALNIHMAGQGLCKIR
jgi:hypothetical protein